MQDSLLETRACKIVYWRQGYARQFIGDKGSLDCYNLQLGLEIQKPCLTLIMNSLLIIITLYNLTARSRHGGALPYMHVHVDFTYHVIYTGNCNFECIVLHVCHDLCKLCWCCKVFSDTIQLYRAISIDLCLCLKHQKKKAGVPLEMNRQLEVTTLLSRLASCHCIAPNP